MRKTIPIVVALSLLAPGIAMATTPTPAPSPSPTPVRTEISDFRVPLGSVVIYGSDNGTLRQIKVDNQGRLITIIGPTPTPAP